MNEPVYKSVKFLKPTTLGAKAFIGYADTQPVMPNTTDAAGQRTGESKFASQSKRDVRLQFTELLLRGSGIGMAGNGREDLIVA